MPFILGSLLEQYDYEQGAFQDDCFKIQAIPLRPSASPDRSQTKKFPEDLVYAYLCEVSGSCRRSSPPCRSLDPSLSGHTLGRTLCLSPRPSVSLVHLRSSISTSLSRTELRARLKNGEDVTLPDGRVVRTTKCIQKERE